MGHNPPPPPQAPWPPTYKTGHARGQMQGAGGGSGGGALPRWVCRACHHHGCRRQEHESRYRRREGDDGDGSTREYDYIVVGLGASGSALARALAEDTTVSVLALDWGPDRRADATSSDLLRTADAAHDPGTSYCVKGASEQALLGGHGSVTGGRAVGGSTLIDSALWGTGGAREWRDFARACMRAGPRQVASTWMGRLAEAASVPLDRIEAYSGPMDDPIGGMPSSSLATAGASSGCLQRLWDPGGDGHQRMGNGNDNNNNNNNDSDNNAGGWQRTDGDGDRWHNRNGSHPMQRAWHEDHRSLRAADPYGRVGYVGADAAAPIVDPTDVPESPMRGAHGPIHVHAFPPVCVPLSRAFGEAAERMFGVRQINDHNGPVPFGAAQHVQFAVRSGPPHHLNRQPAGQVFLGAHRLQREACRGCGQTRALTVLGDAHVVRILFADEPGLQQSRAVGVFFLRGGTEPLRAYARRRIILSASAHTPVLLQRSGIGDARLLDRLGVPHVVANPLVGSGYHCPYGFRMMASLDGQPWQRERGPASGNIRSDANPLGTVGIVLAQDATRPTRRRRQWCVLAAAGSLPDYHPVTVADPLVLGVAAASADTNGRDDGADDGGGGGSGSASTMADASHNRDGAGDAETVVLSGWLLDPTSRGGAIEAASTDPTVAPRVRMGLFSDEADARSLRALAQSVASMVYGMPPLPDGRRLTLVHPPRDVLHAAPLLDMWLRSETFYVAHRHYGACRVGRFLGAPSDPASLYNQERDRGVKVRGGSGPGVVDGLLRVHGVERLSVCDSTVFPHGMGAGTSACTGAILGTVYGDMLLDGIVDPLPPPPPLTHPQPLPVPLWRPRDAWGGCSAPYRVVPLQRPRPPPPATQAPVRSQQPAPLPSSAADGIAARVKRNGPDDDNTKRVRPRGADTKRQRRNVPSRPAAHVYVAPHAGTEAPRQNTHYAAQRARSPLAIPGVTETGTRTQKANGGGGGNFAFVATPIEQVTKPRDGDVDPPVLIPTRRFR